MPKVQASFVLQTMLTKLRAEGKFHPMTVKELGITGLNSFDQLKEMISSNEIVLMRCPIFPSNSPVAQIVLSNVSSKIIFIGYGITILSIFAAFLLSFLYSWWFVLTIFFAPFGIKYMREMLTRELFKSAVNSEIEFCSLYESGVIQVYRPNGDRI